MGKMTSNISLDISSVNLCVICSLVCISQEIAFSYLIFQIFS